MINVVACPHPLRSERVQFELTPGATIEDAVVEAAERGNVPLGSMRNAVVVIGDRIVPKDRWKHTRPKAGPVAIKAMAADPISLSLVVSVAGWAASSGIVSALSLTGITAGLVQAGIAWVTPLRTGMTP
ncbi:MAG: hypothetical protein AB7I32_01080 [Gammaproteobacteria bacterium]